MFDDPSMEVLPVLFLLERFRLTEEGAIDGLDAGPPHQLRRGKRLDKVAAILSVTLSRDKYRYHVLVQFEFCESRIQE